MARTGYKITVYLDDNPLSPTYMHTYEERTLDETACPIPTDDLVLVSNECEIVLTGYTGYRLEIYYNRTTGEYTEQRVLDPECRESSTDEQWVNSGSPYCETNESGINTGYMLQLQVQMNPNLANYGETRTQRYKSPECGGNDCAIWEEVSRQCHVAVYDCVATFDGTADVVQIDISPLSPTYNQTRQINVESTATCDNCTSTTFKWVDMGDVCGDDSLICTNGLTENIKSTNKYNIKRRYKTVSGTDIPMDEYQITLVEEDSEDCGFIRPQYRWDVVAGQYLCDYETYTKYQMLVKMVSYDGGTTWATKQPLETQRGEVLAYDSYDCGKPMYRWIETDDYVCEDNGDDWELASVDSSGNVLTSVTCTNSVLTFEDVQTIAKSGNTYMIGNCVNEISAQTFHDLSSKANGTKIISMGDYVESIGEYGLTHVDLGQRYYYTPEGGGTSYFVEEPLVLSKNLKYLGDAAFSNKSHRSARKLVQFTTEEPPTHTGSTSGEYAVVYFFNMCIVPFGSLIKYKNCSWLSANTTTIDYYLFQEPWTAATDNYKLAIEMSGVTFYLADDYTETLTNFDTLSLCRTISYYFRSIIRDPNASNMSYTGLKAWIGRNVKTLESDAFPQRTDPEVPYEPLLWFTDIYIQSDEPPMVYDNTFRYLINDGQTTRINVPCESYPLYYEDTNWTIYQTYLEPTTTSCITDYEWIKESEVCETSTGKFKDFYRKYMRISGNLYPTKETKYVQTNIDCISVTLSGWVNDDCSNSNVCNKINVDGYSCDNIYYGQYNTSLLINVSGIKHFEFYCAQNALVGNCRLSTLGVFGLLKIYNVDDVQMTGSTYFTTYKWDASKITFELDGGSHVIPIKYTTEAGGYNESAIGSVFLKDEYINEVEQ